MRTLPPRRRLLASASAMVMAAVAALTAATTTAAAAAEPVTLVSSGTTQWRYLDDNTDPAAGTADRTSWAAPGFDDSAWKTGSGSFGAKGGERVPLDGGFLPDVLLNQYIEGQGTTNVPTFFFRTTVDVDAQTLAEAGVLRGSVRYDDAATVYVNGTRVAGFHDDGITENMQYGGSNQAAPILAEFTAPSSVLVPGSNTIAVELHNGRASSSDLYLDVPSITLEETPEATGPTSVMLGVGSDQTQRNLSWFSDTGQPEVVQIAPASASSDGTMPADARVVTPTETGVSLDGVNAYFHATLTELAPATAYSYRVGSEAGGWSEIRTFQTYSDDLEHEFTFVGDPQIGSSGNAERDAQGWAEALDAADRFFPESQFLLSAGDQVETASNLDEYRHLLAPTQMSTQATATTLGNHDVGSPLYHQHFNLPNVSDLDAAGGNYWFLHNGVLHLNINSNSTDYATHERFLRETIAAQGERAHWTILTFHHSIFSVGPHSTSSGLAERRAALAPIISELDIDMVLAGHDHSYARSFLMNGTTPTVPEAEEANADGAEVVRPSEDEVLYITGNSSSGSKYYATPNQNASWVSAWDQSRTPTIANVAVAECSLTTTTRRVDDGTVIDAVELVKDDEAPEIGLPGENRVEVGTAFDPIAGVTISDLCDDLTLDAVTVEGEVDTDRIGSYRLTYRAADEAGNVATVERTVEVVEPGADPAPGGGPTPPGTPGGEPGAPQVPSAPGADAPRGSVSAPATVVAGSTITVEVGEQYAGQRVHAWLFSAPRHLGTHLVAADGTIRVTIPADVDAGRHQLAIYDSRGELIGAQWITVVTASAAANVKGALPSTGAELSSALVPLGAVLLLAGAVTAGATRLAGRRLA
ncbi:DUF5011 domain-containing protein [Aeromicrobium camelliae]|uniref:DUF5011 domain-containing protein n=1 Tax=Aeromicrobium camelliae TaxID=1538144 RepID=A0A3N6X6Y8_9ACTN|nr:fibronectin type III domain-containing protein [Aeromicrobium camelliae]RQN09418.1 DUF5011 domain-containing protein [Aeromicrobium camelliae]